MLPAGCPLGGMMPAIVEAAVGATPAEPLRWHASRLAGNPLDGSLTLHELGVTDGDLIVVSSAGPVAAPRVHGDVGTAVVAAADHSALPMSRVAPQIGLLGCVAAAVALAYSGSPATALHFWVAAGLSAVSAAAALAVRRTSAHQAGLAAVIFAATAGHLAVPEAPWPAKLLLTASAALAMSTAMLRTACRSSIAAGALVAASACVAVVAAACAATQASVPVAGAALTVLALAGLSLSPKLAATLTGIGASPDIDDSTATALHRVFTGLVTGLAGIASAGAALAAVGADASADAAVVFAADIGALLVLRHRVHVDPRRRLALILAGATALTAAGAAAVLAAPAAAYWVAGTAGAAGIAATCLPLFGTATNPVFRQAVQVLEYALLAAVIPLAVWVAGGYGLVRELSLT